MTIGFDPKIGKLLPQGDLETPQTNGPARAATVVPQAMEKPKGFTSPKAVTTHPSLLGTSPAVRSPVDDAIARLKNDLRAERSVRQRAAGEALSLVLSFPLRRTRALRQRAVALCDDVGQQLPEARSLSVRTKALLLAEGQLHELNADATASACNSLIALVGEGESDARHDDKAMRDVMARCQATLSQALVQLAVHFPDALLTHELRLEEALSQALLLAEDAILLAPHIPEGHVALGRVLLCHDDEEAAHDAHEALETALSLEPDFDPAVATLATLELHEGHAQEALARVEQLVARGNNLPHTMLLRGLALAELGRVDEAQRELLRAVKLAPEAGLLYLDAARLTEDLGDSATAEKLYERARELLGTSYIAIAQPPSA